MSSSGQRFISIPARFVLGVITLLAFSACRQPSDETPTPPLRELIDTLSEPGGYFDTDNLVSNETSFAQVLDDLEPMGGAYIGVGPQQNFNYIARLRPRWAFIVDIRRENMLQHLLFNAILTQAETPFQYLCWLFSKPLDTENEVPPGAKIDEMLVHFEKAGPSKKILEANADRLLSTSNIRSASNWIRRNETRFCPFMPPSITISSTYDFTAMDGLRCAIIQRSEDSSWPEMKMERRRTSCRRPKRMIR